MFDKSYLQHLFEAVPTIKSLLRDSDNPKMGRYFLLSYFEDFDRILNLNISKRQTLEWILQRSCLTVLRVIFSIRSRRLVDFDIVKLLWSLAHEKYDELPRDLSNGFFEEILHLFRGLQGKSGIYNQLPFPQFLRTEGREAARLRSEQLDVMAENSNIHLKKYCSGLDEDIKKIRHENRRRILSYLKATDSDWQDYRWHMSNVIRDVEQLSDLISLTDAEKHGVEKAKEAHLPFGITPFYLSLMDYEPGRIRDHAVRAQVIPPLDYVETMLNYNRDPKQSSDFMLERDTSPIALITRRYPYIVILKPYSTCSQICVYCQRNWEINDVLSPSAMAAPEQVDQALDWIRQHPAVTEVLVTGGDPLVMDDDIIDDVLRRLAAIDHVERIRIGSRMPVVLPQRITDALIKIISRYHEAGRREIVLVTHFEHPYEITPEAMEAVQQFKMCGISVYNQTVFTIENSRRFELVALRRLLRLIGVDPYYTFNTKGKSETATYRVPMARLQQEVMEDARLMPGIMRTDEPVYNVPRLGKNYIRAQQHHTLLSILPNGQRVYEFHPWEKKLSLAETYIDVDVSIYDYLDELKCRGEDPEDYKSIWYYF